MITKLDIILLILLLPFSAWAQQHRLEDLHQQLKNAANDTVRIALCAEFGNYYDDVNVDSSVYYNDTGLGIAKQLRLTLNEAELLMNMSFPLAKMGNYPKTLKVLMQAKEIAEDPANEKRVANLKGETARNYRLRMLGYTWLGFGFLYARTGDHQKRIDAYEKGARLATSIKDTLLLAQIAGDLGDTYYILNKPDSALRYLQQSVALFSALPVDQRKFEGSVFLSLGLLYLKMGKPGLVKQNFENAIGISELLNNDVYKGEGYLQIANFYQSTAQPDSSLHYYKKTLDAYKNVGIDKNKLYAYRMISDFYLGQKNKDSSFAYLRMAALMNDSLVTLEKQRLQEFQHIVFDEQLRLRELEEEKIQTRNRSRTYALLTGLGLFLLTGILLYRNNRQKQKANKVLEKTLSDLKSTQQQLIQSEKMASLGELTAGIAHEIQNPLNFVNNFSEINMELLEEVKNQKSKLKPGELDELINDITANEEKINQHGKRADSIVKGMLQHSRKSEGKPELTDINALVEEYLRLSYHGLRAKDKTFNASFEANLDMNLGKILIVPQDIGRVILNLVNNAFYAVNERQKAEGPDFKGFVTVTTKKSEELIEISVTDNGKGIPSSQLEKIFQPFFTTKPTGQGTGLGLSLSYDIIKAHNGKLNVSSTLGQGTVFTIYLKM
jgi:signal transduction histidine kinase